MNIEVWETLASPFLVSKSPKLKKPRNPIYVLVRSLEREAEGKVKMVIPGGPTFFYLIGILI